MDNMAKKKDERKGARHGAAERLGLGVAHAAKSYAIKSLALIGGLPLARHNPSVDVAAKRNFPGRSISKQPQGEIYERD